MGSIIKNQILKHLTKFTKNLSPDKINISTLKGEGEVNNLELDENILMELMDLPTWMRLTMAKCNKVSVKVQWTKLKSQPICLYLDEVDLEIETCSEPRPPNKPSHQSSYRSEGKYGFIDKVIDGIYVHINSVSVKFNSTKFHASLQLSRVKVQSLTPAWTKPTDIRQTRIRSEPTDEILLFKEIDWSTTRMEANAREGDNSLPTTPLRLIANQSKIRIVLKKKLSDCSIIASRIIFLLDDILWVLTDTQLKSAILYANSLSDMIKKSSEQSKQLAAEKLQKQVAGGADQLFMQHQQQQRQRNQTNEAKYFTRYDVLTTSYHMISSRIDLHLCDDTPVDKQSSPKHNQKINGGAMQITFYKLSLDYYPFHYADMDLIVTSGGERKNWYRYSDNQGSRNTWVQELFKAFREEASTARKTCQIISPLQSPTHNSTNKISPAKFSQQMPSPTENKGQAQTQKPKVQGQASPNLAKGQGQTNGTATGQGQTKTRVTKLLESCFVLKIEEFIIYRVSTADNKRSTPQKFFSSDKKALHLPADMSVVHVEYTDYFFTEGIDYPVPHANIYVLVNPVKLHIDYLTILWANYFSLNLAQMVEVSENEVEKKFEHVDIKIEALMPKLLISADKKVENQPDRPDSLQIQCSKLTVSNTRIENQFTLADLKGLLEQYSDCDIFHSNEFPNDASFVTSIPKIFQEFANGHVNPYLCGYVYDLLRGKLPDGFSDKDLGTDAIKVLLRTNTLKRDMRCDMWSLCVDQVWLEFLGVPTSKTRPVPFVESFPLTLWLYKPTSVSGSVVSPSKSMDSVKEFRNGSSDSDTSEKERRRKRQLLKQYYSDDSMDSTSTEPNCAGKPSPTHDADKSNVQYTALKVADFNLVAKIGAKIRAQLTNPQYMFLMRLIESLSHFQIELNADYDDFEKKSDDSSLASSVAASGSYSIPLVIPELEFAIVSPYIAELLPLTNPTDVTCSPDSASFDDRGGFEESENYSQGEINQDLTTFEGQQEDILTVNTANGRPEIEVLEPPPHSGDHHLTHSVSDSTIVRHAQNMDSTQPSQKGMRKDSHSTEDMMNPDGVNISLSAQNVSSAASDSGLSSMGSNISAQRSRSATKMTPTTMRKSLTNFSNSVVGKFKNKLNPDENDDFDSMSISTDASDDDDFEFLALDDTEAPAFNHGRTSDTSSVTDTDDLSSVFADSTAASRAKEVISAVVFRLSGSEVLIQGMGEDLFLALQTKAIDCEETGNITYEDFYAKLSSNSGVIKTPANFQDKKYPVKFKMTMGPCAGNLAPKGSELGVMETRIRDYSFTFRMTSILNMTSFIADEKITVPMPMHVTVDDFTLTIVEDRPPPNPSQAEAAVEPIKLKIHHMFIKRYDDGIFHMTADSKKQEMVAERRQLQEVNNENIKNDINLDISNLSPQVQKYISKLQNENEQLKILAEKFDNHTQKQEQELEELRDLKEQFDNIQLENKSLRDKLKSFSLSSGQSLDDMEDLRKVNSELEKDNNNLMERVVCLDEELANMKVEKQSLLTTLQLMQEELIASESHRQRANTGSSLK